MLYGFRDTTDTSGVLGSNLPSEAMNFNGKFLEKAPLVQMGGK